MSQLLAVCFFCDVYSQVIALTFSLHLGQFAVVSVTSVRASSCSKAEVFFFRPLTDLQQAISCRLQSAGLTAEALLLLENVRYEASFKCIRKEPKTIQQRQL